MTSDCGLTVGPVQHFKKINEIKLHPLVKEFMLVTSWKTCMRVDKNCIVNNQLHLSADRGRTWTKIQDFVIDFEW